MHYGSYCTVKDIKDTLGITATTDDKIIHEIIKAGSRIIDKYTGRTFYVEHGTKYFEGANRVWLHPDLLSVSTVKLDEDGDGTFEATLTSSDYVFLPFNGYPKTSMEISDNSNYSSFAKGTLKGVEIAGEWGFGDGEASSPVIADTKITQNFGSASTSATISSTVNIAVGQNLLIDSEQFYVTEVSASVATVIPGVNGTTKAAHTASTQVYIYEYPSDIKQACINLVTAEFQNRSKKGINSERIGDYSYSIDRTYINSILSDSIRTYRKLGF